MPILNELPSRDPVACVDCWYKDMNCVRTNNGREIVTQEWRRHVPETITQCREKMTRLTNIVYLNEED